MYILNQQSNSEATGDFINIDLSVSFAQKYLRQIAEPDNMNQVAEARFLERRRSGLVEQLQASLRSISAKSWSRTESLLAEQIIRHGINADLIDPWTISGGVYQVYKHAIRAYAEQLPPCGLISKVGSILGETRKQVAAIDPRAIGFVAMQYHYTGMYLMELLPSREQENFSNYVKILDDHLYMPLHRAYEAAAQHFQRSTALQAVQMLVPHMSEVADRIVQRVIDVYPQYRCFSGLLNKPQVRTSSLRDVEMFQVYLWVCILEGNLKALEEELFPLCVMIYPTLNVSWELVRLMTHLLHREMEMCLPLEQARYCAPYYKALIRLFSPEVFPNH